MLNATHRCRHDSVRVFLHLGLQVACATRSSDGGISRLFVVNLKWNGAALQEIVARKQPQRNGTVVTLISNGTSLHSPKIAPSPPRHPNRTELKAKTRRFSHQSRCLSPINRTPLARIEASSPISCLHEKRRFFISRMDNIENTTFSSKRRSHDGSRERLYFLATLLGAEQEWQNRCGRSRNMHGRPSLLTSNSCHTYRCPLPWTPCSSYCRRASSVTANIGVPQPPSAPCCTEEPKLACGGLRTLTSSHSFLANRLEKAPKTTATKRHRSNQNLLIFK